MDPHRFALGITQNLGKIYYHRALYLYFSEIWERQFILIFWGAKLVSCLDSCADHKCWAIALMKDDTAWITVSHSFLNDSQTKKKSYKNVVDAERTLPPPLPHLVSHSIVTCSLTFSAFLIYFSTEYWQLCKAWYTPNYWIISGHGCDLSVTIFWTGQQVLLGVKANARVHFHKLWKILLYKLYTFQIYPLFEKKYAVKLPWNGC